MKARATTRSKSEHTIELSKDDLIALLKRELPDIPGDAKVFMRIPGGGDWSNTDLEVDDHNPVVISFVVEILEKTKDLVLDFSF